MHIACKGENGKRNGPLLCDPFVSLRRYLCFYQWFNIYVDTLRCDVGYSSWVSLKASFPYFLPIIIPSTWVSSHYIQLINLNFVYKTLVFCSNDVAARKLTAYKPLNWISINPTRWKNKIEWCMGPFTYRTTKNSTQQKLSCQTKLLGLQ